jgi:CheY-like chemotaxis protein
MKLETLIVDDDEMVVFLHKIAVAESGLSTKPVVAFNGNQALDHISHQRGSGSAFLILLDINMPELDGWEFLEAIQSLQETIFVVMVTSSVDSRDRNKSKTYKQVIDYVEKPLSINTCIQIKNLPQLANFVNNG